MRTAIVAVAAFFTLTARLLAGPAAAFVIQSSVVHTGVPFSLTVRAVDLSGNTATGYLGTVHFTSSDPAAVLPADYTFTAGDAGVHSFSATLHGDNVNQSITATDTVDSSLKGTGNFIVRNPAIVVYFAADLPQYSTREAQTPFVVTALNSDGDKVSGYRGTVTFSASLAGPDPSVDVPPDYTFTEADAGSHTFNVVFHRGYQHQVWVTDVDTGAQGSDQTTVVCPDITLTATNSGPVCPGSSVTLTALTNAQEPSFNWHLAHGGGGLVLYGNPVTTTVVATWEVYMTDNATGCLSAAQTVVQYEPVPAIFAPSTASGDFTASISSDPNGPYSNIDWSVTSGGSIAAGQGTATVTIHPDPAATRVYFAVAATRVSTGCRQSNDSSTGIVAAPLSAAITAPASVCPSSNASASVADAGAGATYSWSAMNGMIVSGQGTPGIVFTAPASGAVELSATVTRSPYSASGTATVSVAAPAATLVSEAQGPICAGNSATIDVTLTGTPPFTLTWSDGFTQSGIMTMSTSRQVVPSESAAYAVTSVSDAACSGGASNVVILTVLNEPAIIHAPQSVAVRASNATTLAVEATGDRLMFQWYEGAPGDFSKPVGKNAPTFTTPPITQPTSYWVRITNACGSANSAAAVISPARGRAARH